MSYTPVFGGGVVDPSLVSYASFSLTADLTLFWPLPGIKIAPASTTQTFAARTMDIGPTGAGHTVTLPAANLVSPGMSILFANLGGGNFSFDVQDNAGGPIFTIDQGDSIYIYLTDNSTAAGVWQAVPWGGGVTAVTSVGLISASNNITVVSSTTNPITGTGTFTLDLALNLDALSLLTTTGIMVSAGANTFLTRTITGTANQITVTNGAGIAGSPVLSLPNAVVVNTSLTAQNIRIGVVDANTISTGAGNLNLLAAAGSAVAIKTATPLAFYNSTNTFYTSFQAGNLTTNIAYQWPTTAPAISQVPRISAIGALNIIEWASIPTFPGVSTVNAVAKYLDTVGSLQNSGVIIDVANAITGVTSLTSGNFIIAANTISTSIGAINLTPNGASAVIMTGLTFPTAANLGNIESCVLTADGANNIIFSSTSNDNILINGAMDIWQRNSTFTTVTFFPNDSGIYTADYYWLEAGIGNSVPIDNVVNVTKTARAFKSAACSFDNVMRFTIETTGVKFATFQFVESIETAKHVSQSVSFSFVCAASSATGIRAAVISYHGAVPDTIPKPIIDTFNVAGTNPTLSADWDYVGGTPVNVPITSTLTRLKLENVTVPANCVNLGIMIWYDQATAVGTTTLDISAIKLERGPSCTAFQPRHVEQEILLCQRWFRKSWRLNTAVGTAASVTQKAVYNAAISPVATTFTYGVQRYDTEMRIAPTTLNLYSLAATQNVATSLTVNGAGDTELAANSAILVVSDRTGFSIKNNSGGNIASASTAFLVHFYADASL